LRCVKGSSTFGRCARARAIESASPAAMSRASFFACLVGMRETDAQGVASTWSWRPPFINRLYPAETRLKEGALAHDSGHNRWECSLAAGEWRPVSALPAVSRDCRVGVKPPAFPRHSSATAGGAGPRTPQVPVLHPPVDARLGSRELNGIAPTRASRRNRCFEINFIGNRAERQDNPRRCAAILWAELSAAHPPFKVSDVSRTPCSSTPEVES